MQRRIVYLISKLGYWGGTCALLVYLIIIMAQVFLRKLLVPATGFFEVGLIFGLFLFSFSWIYTQVRKGHVSVDIVILRFQPRTQSLIDSIMHLLSIGVCLLMSWCSIRYACMLQDGGEVVSSFIPIPLFIPVGVLAFIFMLLAILILIDTLDLLANISRKI